MTITVNIAVQYVLRRTRIIFCGLPKASTIKNALIPNSTKIQLDSLSHLRIVFLWRKLNSRSFLDPNLVRKYREAGVSAVSLVAHTA